MAARSTCELPTIDRVVEAAAADSAAGIVVASGVTGRAGTGLRGAAVEIVVALAAALAAVAVVAAAVAVAAAAAAAAEIAGRLVCRLEAGSWRRMDCVVVGGAESGP